MKGGVAAIKILRPAIIHVVVITHIATLVRVHAGDNMSLSTPI